ncbi:MAG: DUF3656 domain-containing protein [Opitutales bacterium]
MGKTIPQRLSTPAENTALLSAKPRLLAPAGNWECVRAAAANGADAVYFGLPQFNARLRADNFELADLPELMTFLHERGMRGYVTLNTLVFTDELAAAETFLQAVINAGVDAAIVQDIGICRLIRQLSPDFPIHASTQMTVTDLAGVELAAELGCETVVLARECSLREVAAIRAETLARGLEVSLEIFVHGALCVAYSGQCLTSEALGGRSANRGECAQACRLPYELVSDGQLVELEGRSYLLSPQDLAGVSQLPEIVRAGVSTLKIEGRLKSPEYVAGVCQVYRRALDAAWHGREAGTDRSDEYQLSMTFSRGFYTGWLEGIDNQRLVHGRYGKKRGLYLGRVTHVTDRALWVRTSVPVARGDGLVFVTENNDDEAIEVGGRVYDVKTEPGGEIALGFGVQFDYEGVIAGMEAFKTSDPALDKRLRQSWEQERTSGDLPVAVVATGRAGTPLRLAWHLVNADLQTERVAEDCAEDPVPDPVTADAFVETAALQPAAGRPLTAETLRKQLGRLGEVPFKLRQLHFNVEEDVFLPVSALNAARREAVDQLRAKLKPEGRWTLVSSDAPAIETRSLGSDQQSGPYLIPYAREMPQLRAALNLGYREVYLELENPRAYREAVAKVRETEQRDGSAVQVWIAPPRIFKSGEDWLLKELAAAAPDGVLARNHAHLSAWPGLPKRGDFSLNVANPLTAAYLRERFDLARLTASYDLDAAQLTDLLEGCPPRLLEITLHQHVPMFHMEHCVFCAFMSTGKDFRDCGRPCEKHSVSLRDRVGREHPLRADGGCRNTVYNARAQTGAEYADTFAKAGAAAFRIEFLRESAEEVRETMARYERLLNGETIGENLWRELKLMNQLGVTRGTLRDS